MKIEKNDDIYNIEFTVADIASMKQVAYNNETIKKHEMLYNDFKVIFKLDFEDFELRIYNKNRLVFAIEYYPIRDCEITFETIYNFNVYNLMIKAE